MFAHHPAAALGPRIDLARFADPLDLLAAEHAQLRAICASLGAMATAERMDPQAARALAAALRATLPPHIVDEGRSFFPLLRARAEPEDEIEPVLAHMSADHADAVCQTEDLLNVLDGAGAGPGDLTGVDRTVLAHYADAKLRHLSLETAILLPIARQRLSDGDLQELRNEIAARRANALAVPA